MVDTNKVKHIHIKTQACHPPVELTLFQTLPVKNRISPQLSGFTEVIRRNSTNKSWIKIFIEIKNIGICPNIRTIRGNIHRNIANYFNTFFVGIFFQTMPLPEKLPLQKHPEINFLF